jgi:hypothetical protein
MNPNLPLIIAFIAGLFAGGAAGFFACGLWMAKEIAHAEKATWRAAMRYYTRKRAQEERDHV